MTSNVVLGSAYQISEPLLRTAAAEGTLLKMVCVTQLRAVMASVIVVGFVVTVASILMLSVLHPHLQRHMNSLVSVGVPRSRIMAGATSGTRAAFATCRWWCATATWYLLQQWWMPWR